MQDQIKPLDQQDPGMIKDRTKDEGMPLRNHEQVLLLNDGMPGDVAQDQSAPQATNGQTNPNTMAIT